MGTGAPVDPGTSSPSAQEGGPPRAIGKCWQLRPSQHNRVAHAKLEKALEVEASSNLESTKQPRHWVVERRESPKIGSIPHRFPLFFRKLRSMLRRIKGTAVLQK